MFYLELFDFGEMEMLYTSGEGEKQFDASSNRKENSLAFSTSNDTSPRNSTESLRLLQDDLAMTRHIDGHLLQRSVGQALREGRKSHSKVLECKTTPRNSFQRLEIKIIEKLKPITHLHILQCRVPLLPKVILILHHPDLIQPLLHRPIVLLPARP